MAVALDNYLQQPHLASGCNAESTSVIGRQLTCNSHEGRLVQHWLCGVCFIVPNAPDQKRVESFDKKKNL